MADFYLWNRAFVPVFGNRAFRGATREDIDSSPSFTLSPTNRGLLVEVERCAEEARNTVWVRFCFDGAIAWRKSGFANTPWVLCCTRKDEKECIVGIRLKLEIEPSWPTTERANRNNANCTRASRMRGCPSPIGYYGRLLGAQQIV